MIKVQSHSIFESKLVGLKHAPVDEPIINILKYECQSLVIGLLVFAITFSNLSAIYCLSYLLRGGGEKSRTVTTYWLLKSQAMVRCLETFTLEGWLHILTIKQHCLIFQNGPPRQISLGFSFQASYVCYPYFRSLCDYLTSLIIDKKPYYLPFFIVGQFCVLPFYVIV